ncbi:hypothetical protein C7C56_021380 [Massilia glaciei]|uniref:Uncharacterized protein n=1 Tax=Massilia glaciei TaxID=1524097 RepID=A0A2U2HFL4_9BURK|nr:hypothetical protein C7C56_021380 [Massilia glaciei]
MSRTLPILLHDKLVGHGFASYDVNRHEEIFKGDHKELRYRPQPRLLSQMLWPATVCHAMTHSRFSQTPKRSIDLVAQQSTIKSQANAKL